MVISGSSSFEMFNTARFMTPSGASAPLDETTLSTLEMLPTKTSPTETPPPAVEGNEILNTLFQAVVERLLTPPAPPPEEGPGKSAMAPGQRAKLEGGRARDFAPGQIAKKQAAPPAQ